MLAAGSISSRPEPKARGYGALFVTLLIFFAATPLVEKDGFMDLVLSLMIVGALLNALRTVVRDWRIVAVAVLFGAGAIAGRPLLHLAVSLRLAIIVQTVSMIVFLLVVAVPLLPAEGGSRRDSTVRPYSDAHPKRTLNSLLPPEGFDVPSLHRLSIQNARLIPYCQHVIAEAASQHFIE